MASSLPLPNWAFGDDSSMQRGPSTKITNSSEEILLRVKMFAE
jgi:hypothetical protein